MIEKSKDEILQNLTEIMNATDEHKKEKMKKFFQVLVEEDILTGFFNFSIQKSKVDGIIRGVIVGAALSAILFGIIL